MEATPTNTSILDPSLKPEIGPNGIPREAMVIAYTEKYLKELDELRYQLTATKTTTDASVASAQSAQLQCFALLKELDEKNHSLKEHEDRVQRLAEQLDNLENDLQ
ncbi:hypothetical protein Dimus_022417 [Dionaea muscipula]